MKILLAIVLYVAFGYIAILSGVIIHLIKAEKNGYKALDWWNKNKDGIAKGTTKLDFIIGLFIWWQRLYNFYANIIPQAYSLYERKEVES